MGQIAAITVHRVTSLATLRREVTVINATVAPFMSPLTKSSDGSNPQVNSVRTGVQGWGGRWGRRTGVGNIKGMTVKSV